MLGFAVLTTTVLGFGAWASTAPIDGAIIASGIYVATGQNKFVQHLEGGIIKEILVREGDAVEEGQPLIRLDDTEANANLRRLVLRYSQRTAKLARLRAESSLEPEIEFPDTLVNASSDRDIQSILDNQTAVFNVRRDRLTSEISILEREIAAFREQIEGADSQLISVGQQFGMVGEELEAKNVLLQKGLISKPDILQLQRSQARLDGEAGRLRAEIGDVHERIARANRQIARANYIYSQQAVEELYDVQSEMQDLRERIRAARKVLERIDINAPVDGIVIKMNYFTPGGVIEPGKDILELLPVGDELVIEAHIRPEDIDNVETGQEAIVRLSALNQRVTPMIPGKVIYVSADRLANEERAVLRNEDVFIARISLDAERAQEADFKPTPGMPTEVYIKTGQRTFFKYLMQPVIDSMQRAFRES